ncbi:MAG: hypothetical protein R3B48_12480 [Kofleriaceae bacterium]
MKHLLVVALSLPLAACVVEVDDGPGDGSGSGSGSGSNAAGEVSGSITENATWTGTVTVKGPTTIESGVVITVAAGSTLAFNGSNSLTIKGTLDVQGTSTAKVNIQPSTGMYFGGITNSGTLKLNYAVQKGGGIYTQSGSSTFITDTQLSAVQGDFLVMSGGDLTMTYSQVGIPNDSTHCELHFSSAGNVSITHTNIVGADYGFMFYGGANGTYTNNNWFGNGIHIDATSGASGDFTGSWFENLRQGGATPNVTGLPTLTNAPAKLTDAGVRP